MKKFNWDSFWLGVIFTTIISVIIIFLFFTLKSSVEQLKQMCPEIDELCEKDFIRMCKNSIPEIIGINTDTYCDRIFEARCEETNCYCN